MGAGGCFFKTLNYASVNEDWRTEAEALRPGPEDTVLCVTGSGDRPLDLLARAAPRRDGASPRPSSSGPPGPGGGGGPLFPPPRAIPPPPPGGGGPPACK